MNPSCRRAQLPDLPALCALGNEVNLLHHAALPDVFAPLSHADRDEAMWRDAIEGEGCAAFVAERGSRVIGFVTAEVADESATHFRPVRFCRIGTLGVTESERGQGVGRALVAEVERWARGHAASEIHLNVWRFNTAATRLYETLGYEARAQFMVKRLGPAAAPASPQARPGESVSYTTHDDLPREPSRLVDEGLGEANDLAAPLHEVQPLSCFARLPSGRVIGGAVGRSWGPCCELQQLWVEPARRQQGIATELIKAFEAHGRRRGCRTFYLETFNFQAPALYRSLGYEVRYEHAVYPHGIVKYVMVHET